MCKQSHFFNLRGSLAFDLFNIVPLEFWSVNTMNGCPNSYAHKSDN